MPTPKKHTNATARQAAYRQRQREASRTTPAGSPLRAVPSCPGPARWRRLVQEAERLLLTAEQEMEEIYGQRSDKWQESERGEAHREQQERLQEAQVLLGEYHP